MKVKASTATFADIGEIFNDATTRMVGGISDQNRGAILKDIAQVQDGLEKLIQSNPNDFQGVAGIHAQNIVDQLNLEVSAIKSIGTDPFAAKYINDVQRDLIDIVQGDEHLAALANQGGHNGFAAVPDLLVLPAQFPGNPQQVEFMKGFITTTQDFADRAVAIVDQGGTPEAAHQLAGEIQAYTQAANEFTIAQGGLYSARFNNEFAAEGVNGTASRALIDGLSTGNADKVHAAAQVLAANAADVAGNMLGVGEDRAPTGNGIPDQIQSVAQAGTVFNDATAKLIGGIYDGNRQSIHDDLTATRQGLTDLLSQGQLDGKAGAHAQQIVDLLGKEISAVDQSASGADVSQQVGRLHGRIIDIVQKDATLAAAATEDGAQGFMGLPGTLHGNGAGYAVAGGSGDGPGRGDNGHGQAGGARTVATTSDHAWGSDHLAQIFHQDGHHHFG